MKLQEGAWQAPPRILMGPGPSDVDPRVLLAGAQTAVGYLDPAFTTLLDDIMVRLRATFRTENWFTVALSGTGMAGMELCLVNAMEAGDRIVVGANGIFGGRICDIAERCGADVTRVETPWGRIVAAEDLERAVKASQPKVVAVVHAETSTGVLQPLSDARRIASEAGALLLVDTVTSLGGVDVRVDEWGIDMSYSATQKCLGCPPGLAPVTLSDRAREVIRARQRKCPSYYLDVALLERYWSEERVYHQTPACNMLYALREGLRLVAEEGLEARQERHRRNAAALQAGLQAMGMRLFAQEGHRLPSLTTVYVPEGADDAVTRGMLRDEFHLEIGGGLGEIRGKVWRIGLMGASSTAQNVLHCLASLERALRRQGVAIGSGTAAAVAALDG
jgi:alanine-glyoxylate transaminase/serine-glyoxylate transaminase/serine-pyruvate transaminase